MMNTKSKIPGKIIVCDDDVTILEVVAHVLEQEGYEVVTIDNSSQLYDALDRHQPDLLIVDLWMPRLNGEDIIRHLREDTSKLNIPILMLSASAIADRLAMQAGADAFMAKPVDRKELLAAVAKLIGRGK